MPITVERKINLGFGLAFLLLILLGWLCYRSTRETLDTAQWVAHTQEVLVALSSLDSDLSELQLNKRIYQLTGQEAALQAALAALQTCAYALDPVEALTEDNPAQQARVQQFRPLLEQVRQSLSKGRSANTNDATLDRATPFLTRLRAILHDMEQEERSLLDARRAASEAQARSTFNLVGFASVFAIIFAGVTLGFIQRDMRQRRRAEELLRLNEARTRQIVDTANDAFILIDSQSKVVDWNRRAETTFGWVRREVLGRPLAELIVPPQHRAGHARGVAHYLKTGEGPILNRRVELTALRRDGTEFPVELAVVPLRLASGTFFSCFVHDITERNRVEQELRQARDRAESASRAKSEFLANMSHELRTPLNSVIGFTNILLKNKAGNLRPQDATYLERIAANGRHLLALINDLLDLSKIEAGKVEVELAPVSLNILIEETLAQLEGRTLGKPLKLYTRFPESMAPLETDPGLLRQMLINLVGNAMKFTESGSITVQVSVEPQTRRPVRIDVIDTGIGIPEDKLELIFEAFRQADSGTARQYGGTGLGLTITRALCRLLNFRIEVASEEGQGSTFTLWLTPPEAGAAPPPAPLPRGRTLEFVIPAPAVAAADKGGDLKDKAVLVIDDDPDARTVLTTYLEDFGCRVVAAASGEEGLRLARERRPELITLDLLMPRMDGWAVLQALKQDAELSAIPVVIVSIVARQNASAGLGVVGCLEKPIERETLLQALRGQLTRQKRRVLVVDTDDHARHQIIAYLAGESLELRTARSTREALGLLLEFVPDLVLLDLTMSVKEGIEFLEALRKNSRLVSLPVIVSTRNGLSDDELRRLGAEALCIVRSRDELPARMADALRKLSR